MKHPLKALFMSAFFIFFLLKTQAQIYPFLGANTAQSSSDYDWLKIENRFVEVIFPEGHEKEAQRSARALEQFAAVSGENLGIKKPQKFPLILRPQMALPNGFVTLAPRRSEWFLHQSINPLVGGMDFIEALAIHEYRHINQFDFSFRNTNKLGYWFFGEFGQAFLAGAGMPNWYFEGDAVWAETFFTEGGRGRSPRFWARLKAMVLSEQFPKYDELAGRSYRTILPNHYVFGYFLIARAYKYFGDDFWKKVYTDVTQLGIDPYRIYRKFEEHSGVEFEQFLYDTLVELKEQWEKEGDRLPKVARFAPYRELRYPIGDQGRVYSLQQGINSFWQLYSGKNKIKDIPTNPRLSKIDIKRGKAGLYPIPTSFEVWFSKLLGPLSLRYEKGQHCCLNKR